VELYGHRGYESDLEVLTLMLETLSVAGISEVHLDLGHVAIFRELVRRAELGREREVLLFEALQRKALPEIRQYLTAWSLPASCNEWFPILAELNGGIEVLDEAEARLTEAGAAVREALAVLRNLIVALRRRWPELPIHVDLAELRGYRYHTGVVFAAYVPGQGQAVAQGGRYDEIGQVFGRARPATGFSTDLATLLRLGPMPDRTGRVIGAPAVVDVALERRIAELRGQGERVIQALPGAEADPWELGCDHVLARREGAWSVVPLSEASGENS
jgi:ATP phosphoribosyltransferase regulatory subunit